MPVPSSWAPYMIKVKGTSIRPQKDPGNYLGPCILRTFISPSIIEVAMLFSSVFSTIGAVTLNPRDPYPEVCK